MRPASPALALLFCCLSLPAFAAKVQRVDIQGLDEAMTENVRVALSLEDSLGKDISQRRLEYLIEAADDETREALEPFGYYAPAVFVSRDGGDAALVVTIRVNPGEPVRIRNVKLAIEGGGQSDRYMRAELENFVPKRGDVLNHQVYEQSKARVTRRLAERGYFDADFVERRVEVTRAEHAADMALVWDSGERYDMGAITFVQTPKQIIRPQLLEKLVYWQQGEYYHQGRLDRLRRSLVSLDYFSRVDISPDPENSVDYEVPVTVTLTPAKRSVYEFGVSYGTDSGFGVSGGIERRYLNQRGHKALAQIDYAQKRKTMTLQYRVPAFRWLDGWYTASLQAADEQTSYMDTRRLELVASRSGEINSRLTAVAALHALRERWAYVDPSYPDFKTDYEFANYVFPSLRAEYIDVDDRLYPRNGLGGTLMLRGGAGYGKSNRSFAQIHASARWFRGLGERNRLIARGEAGYTFIDEVSSVSPSLRYYAGGDRSIRGYAWREVGPRIVSGDGRRRFALGAKKVITTSLEFERYFTPAWGAAVFVDHGSAFDDKPDWRTGVGIGLRWRSPVGPVRVDVARGLNQPDSAFQLHLNIGADL